MLEWTGLEWMDTPYTVTTTRAPAVLKMNLVKKCADFRKAKAKYENHEYQDENDNTAPERPDSPM